ncbi:MAG: ABC transporter substrate-binding protein [Actinomycetota bacterium]|nr:ABC transporter substrate-binding protein [Actinomycetota bacterium]
MNGLLRRRVLVALATVALLAGACSTKATGGKGDGKSGGVKTGIGVTKDTINLGILTDLHGVFASLGTSITNGNKLYWKLQNDKGGVCGRKIKLIVKDHGYDVQQAVPLYQQLKGQVLSLQQALGSPINTALLDQYTQDEMLAIPSAWASTLLRNDYIMEVGSTYDYEMINATDWLIGKGMLKPGDKVGHIYFEGEYGSNGLLGTKYAASKNNLTVVEQKIKATDVDVSAQIQNLKSANVKAIFMTAGPKQSAAAAGVAASIGFNVPIMSSNPGWTPGLLKTPAAPALQKSFYLVASWASPASDNSAVTEFVDKYKAAYPGKQIDGGITWALGASTAYREVLQKACDNKDLTRKGIHDAFRSLSAVDTQQVIAPLNYSTKGAAPTPQVYVFRADAATVGGLKQVEGLYEGKDAKGYTPPALKK